MRDPGQTPTDSHASDAGVDLAPTSRVSVPRGVPSAQPLDPGQSAIDIQRTDAGVDLAPTSECSIPRPDPPAQPFDPGQGEVDTHTRSAGVDLAPANEQTTPQTATPAQPLTTAAQAALAIFADQLDDLERLRIATEGRVRSARQIKGLDGQPELAQLEALTGAIAELEHRTTLALQRSMRAHPLGGWVKRTVGIGLKQGARLIAAIGDPAIRSATVDGDTGEIVEPARPRRGPAELWAYCGYHVVDGARPRRQRGRRANWNGQAKMRAHLCAESCVKQMRSPYRKVYDDARAHWADRDTTDLHKHNHALSMVAKAILRDLWLEARR